MPGLALAQRVGERIRRRRRHRQLAREPQVGVGVGEAVLRQRGARLGERHLGHGGEPGARIAAVGIDRQRGFVQFARAGAVACRQAAGRQRHGGLFAQRLGAGFRPQPVGDGRAQQHERHDHRSRAGESPAPRHAGVPDARPGRSPRKEAELVDAAQRGFAPCVATRCAGAGGFVGSLHAGSIRAGA